MPTPPLSLAPIRRGPFTPARSGPVVLVVGPPSPEAMRLVARLLASDARPLACVGPLGAWQDAVGVRGDEASRLHLYDGSAARPGLGLAHTAWRLLDDIEEIYCVAPARETATRHVHDFADECPRLRRLHIVPARGASGGSRSGTGRAAVRLVSRAASRPLALARAALAAARAGLTGALDLEFDAALSRDDLEHDLWPGLPRQS